MLGGLGGGVQRKCDGPTGTTQLYIYICVLCRQSFYGPEWQDFDGPGSSPSVLDLLNLQLNPSDPTAKRVIGTHSNLSCLWHSPGPIETQRWIIGNSTDKLAGLTFMVIIHTLTSHTVLFVIDPNLQAPVRSHSTEFYIAWLVVWTNRK